LHSIAS